MAERKKRGPDRSGSVPDLERMIAHLELLAADLRKLIEARKLFLPAAVRKHRHRLDLTGAQYAQLLGVTPRVVYGWEEAT